MNKVKRFLAMLLSVAMVFDSMPAAVIAEQDDQTEEVVVADDATEDAEASEEVIPEETLVSVGNEEAANEEFEDIFLAVGNEHFTKEKRIIEVKGGTAYFEPETNTLTLSANKGEKITGVIGGIDGAMIMCDMPELHIRGEAELKCDEYTGYGIWASGDVYIDGDIAITAWTDAVRTSGSVIVNGTLTAEADSTAVYAEDSISVNGSLTARSTGDDPENDVLKNAAAVHAKKMVTIHGRVEASLSSNTTIYSAIRGLKGVSISGEEAYVHVKGPKNTPILSGPPLELGEYIRVTDPAGGYVSANNAIFDAEGNRVKEATIRYDRRSYTVSFNMSGKDATDVPETQTVPENGYAVKPATDPKAEGFDFEGWCADEDCTEEFDFAKTKISENKTVYAKWTDAEAATYTVSFNMSGKDATNIPETQTVSKNGLATKPASDPKAKGFVFAGWYADAALTKEYTFTEPVTADITIYAKWDDDLTIVDKYPTSWNLFENEDEHVFKLNGVSSNKAVGNRNAKSSKFYDATLEGSEIKVTLKSGVNRKKAAKAANTTLEFNLEDQGIVEYKLPVQYVKPALKLSKSSVPIVGDAVETKVLRKASSGLFEPFDISDATLSYDKGGNVSGNEAGGLIVSNVKKGKGKICITKKGWAETIKIKFTVKAATDVYVDLGDLKTVVVNKNAPEQKQIFDFYASGEVKISDKKNTGLITISGNKAIIAYKNGVKKGTYKIKLTVGKSSQTVKVKVSEKALENSVKMSVKGKYDVVTKQRMVLIPQYKEISGKILSVSSDTPGYTVAVNEAGNIVVGCTTDDIVDKRLKMKDLSMKLMIEGVNDPVAVNVKKIKASKTTPTFAKVEFSMPNGAGGTSNEAVANLVYTYKDSAKMLHEITPEKLEVSAKSCKAELKDGDNGHVYIKDLSEKKGTVTLTAYFPFGVKRKGSIKLKKSN